LREAYSFVFSSKLKYILAFLVRGSILLNKTLTLTKKTIFITELVNEPSFFRSGCQDRRSSFDRRRRRQRVEVRRSKIDGSNRVCQPDGNSEQ
jgi:hypothetical protein